MARPDPRQSQRVARLNELLREVVADELRRIDDERLEMVTITEVRTDRDLTYARVWFDAPDDQADEEIVPVLEEHRAALQRAIGRQTRLRRVPPLQFEPDETIRGAARIEAILRDIEPAAEAGDGGDEAAGGPEQDG